MQLNKNWGDRGMLSSASQKASRSILDKLKPVKESGVKTKVEGVTVIQSRSHKSMNELFKIFMRDIVLSLSNKAQLVKARFDY